MSESEKTEQISPIMEQLATQVARNRADVARWGLNLVIFLFTVMIIIIVMNGQDISIDIIAPTAITGLSIAWIAGWQKGRRLFQDFYAEELLDLQGKSTSGVKGSDLMISEREKQILNFVARGQANKLIAADLGITEQTVKNHVTSILRRLRAKDRTEAVVIAIKQGLITLN